MSFPSFISRYFHLASGLSVSLLQAQENHYLLVSNTLEYSLRLLKRLLDCVDEASQPSPEDIYTVSDTVIPAWSVITGHQAGPTIVDSAGSAISKRRLFYTQLLDTPYSKRDQCDRLSLCCAGHRGVREWATRCLASLLRVESEANKKFLSSAPVEDTEAIPGAGLTRSAFFNQLRKKRKTRIALVCFSFESRMYVLHSDHRCQTGCLRQSCFIHSPMSVLWLFE